MKHSLIKTIESLQWRLDHALKLAYELTQEGIPPALIWYLCDADDDLILLKDIIQGTDHYFENCPWEK